MGAPAEIGRFSTYVSVHPGGAAVVECRGELDLTSREEIGSLLKQALADHELVIVDLTWAEFIDSSFIHNLLIADGLARTQRTGFRVQYETAAVKAVLQTTGILAKLDCATTRQEVLG